MKSTLSALLDAVAPFALAGLLALACAHACMFGVVRMRTPDAELLSLPELKNLCTERAERFDDGSFRTALAIEVAGIDGLPAIFEAAMRRRSAVALRSRLKLAFPNCDLAGIGPRGSLILPLPHPELSNLSEMKTTLRRLATEEPFVLIGREVTCSDVKLTQIDMSDLHGGQETVQNWAWKERRFARPRHSQQDTSSGSDRQMDRLFSKAERLMQRKAAERLR